MLVQVRVRVYYRVAVYAPLDTPTTNDTADDTPTHEGMRWSTES
jgi:hypothetical protein